MNSKSLIVSTVAGMLGLALLYFGSYALSVNKAVDAPAPLYPVRGKS